MFTDDFTVTMISSQGWWLTMEDHHVILYNQEYDFYLFCIFDGHGGDLVAKFCA